MEKIKNFCRETCGNVSKTGWIIVEIVVALILLVIVGFLLVKSGKDIWPFNNNPSEEEENYEISFDEEELERVFNNANDAVLSVEDVFNGQYENSVESATLFVNNTREVQVAVVFDNVEYSVEGAGEVSCGKFAFVSTRVPEVPGVINETLKSIFEDKVATDFMPGNIIPTYHTNLLFENAVLEEGVAKVYLKGDFAEEENSTCKKDLAITQIVETVSLFDTVDSVEVYQNLKKVN